MPSTWFIETKGLRSLEGLLDVIDAGHPDYLDWRQARLHFDTVEGRWGHFEIIKKARGRPALELTADVVFRMTLRQSFYLLLDRCGLEEGGINNNDRTPSSFFVASDDTPYVSFSTNVTGPRTIRSQSAHERLHMQAAWSEILEAQARRRDGGLR